MKRFCVYLLLALSVVSSVTRQTQGCTIDIRNKCPYKLAVCTQTTDKPPAAAGPIQQYDLAAGGTKTLDLGSACKFPSGVVYAAPSGKCAVTPNSNAATTDRSKVNLMELNINAADGDDNYDLSAKDGYAVPQQIKPSKTSCATVTCKADLGAICKGGNTIVNFPGGSPDKACQNVDGFNPNNHVATPNTRLFKQACPDAYSYDFDDRASLKSCSHGTSYDLTFCP